MASRDWMGAYAERRRAVVEKNQLEIAKLEKRVEKVVLLHENYYQLRQSSSDRRTQDQNMASNLITQRDKSLHKSSSQISIGSSRGVTSRSTAASGGVGGTFTRTQRSQSLLSDLQIDNDQLTKKSLKQLEQEIVVWEQDTPIQHCIFCMNKLPSNVMVGYLNRFAQSFSDLLIDSSTTGNDQQSGSASSGDTFRHHCRLCGRVVCGRAACSQIRSLSVYTDKEVGSIRVCKECNSLVFIRQNHLHGLQIQSELEGLYTQIQSLEQNIFKDLQVFNEYLGKLQHMDTETIKKEKRLYQVYIRAKEIRTQLLHKFGQYEGFVRDIAKLRISYSNSGSGDMKPQHQSTHTQQVNKLLSNVNQRSLLFLQNNMFTLKLLPELSDFRPTSKNSQQSGKGRWDDKSLPGISGNSQQDQDEIQRQQQMRGVLLEQKAQLLKMIDQATKDRKFEDLKSLTLSLNDIEQELNRNQL
ncbi:hypothetical protein MP228_000019 [Amoeboaphelidium protococcarum]|nr:hypothetical protein MP228_000019 [Amoeboaphelidium protococcarum]